MLSPLVLGLFSALRDGDEPVYVAVYAAHEEGFWLFGPDIAATTVVFALSIPLALAVGPAAMWSRLVPASVRGLLRWWAMRARRDALTRESGG
ncbi:hypothetical protein [Streptomyces sp. NPDC057381]|uniref:hypothetical protein n=1 Tax=unclassified Streptomyces TaxID=2593676 RepID=UPI00363E4E2B